MSCQAYPQLCQRIGSNLAGHALNLAHLHLSHTVFRDVGFSLISAASILC
jgi:hypothetical protein